MLFEIMLREETTNVFIKAETASEALRQFKKQRLHIPGVKKGEYEVKEMEEK